MANRSKFAGTYNAWDFAYGVNIEVPALTVLSGSAATGTGTLTLMSGYVSLSDGTNVAVLNANAPIAVGSDSGLDSITPTAASNGTQGQVGSASVTGSFTYLHGTGDPVTSGTFGLQEAINYAAGKGGGVISIDNSWYLAGGTLAIISAAVLPYSTTLQQQSVKIVDNSTSPVTSWGLRYNTTTLLAAPSIPLITQLASLTGVVGTFTAATYYFNFIYVDAQGGLTLASSQYSFTATVSLAVGGSGPVAEAGAVGYLVMSSATSTTYINNPLATTSVGTIIYPGGVACFKIGTSFTVTAPGTNALALAPVEATAYARGMFPFANPSMIQPFPTTMPPFAATGTVTAGTALEAARVDLPAGFLNYLGRKLRITAIFTYTPVSTATMIPALVLYGGIYGVSGVTLWTVTTVATSGTTASDGIITIELTTAVVGATGAFQGHGQMAFASATASHPLYAVTGDSISANTSTVDLTKQDTLSLTINSGTANLTTFQVLDMTVEVLA